MSSGFDPEEARISWERELAFAARQRMRREARERIQRRIQDGNPPSDDWVELNQGIYELIFRTDWSDDWT
jgi:hypothetical protein